MRRVSSNLKNIFIIGPSRAGKTSLAIKLEKMGYNHIVMDAVIETMTECFPKSGIRHGNLESEEFKTFLESFCRNHFKYGLPYIIDLEVLNPDFAKEIIHDDESTAVYMGYPSLTPEEKIAQVREHDTKFDWTRNISDEELKEMFRKNIEVSKKLQVGAIKNGYSFLDVSYNREQVLNDFIRNSFEKQLFYRDDSSYDRYER